MASNRRTFLKAGLATSLIGGIGLFVKGLVGSNSNQSAPTSAPSSSTTVTSRPTPTLSPIQTPSVTATPMSDADISHGPTDSGKVALTFHGAGDAKLAQAILDEVKSAGIGITVMAVGSWVVDQPQWVKRIVAEGHDLGNHTMTHQAMMHLSAAQASREIAQCSTAIHDAVGQDPKWFRPSGTPVSNATIRRAAQAHGFAQCITYNVDSMDYTDPATSVVVNSVLDVIKSGDIVSLHLGHAVTTKALPKIIEGISAKSLTMVTVSDLLGA